MKPILTVLLFVASIGSSCSQTSKANIKKSNYFLNKAFYLRMDNSGWDEYQGLLLKQRRYVDSALALNPNNLDAYSLKVSSFAESKKFDSAVVVCNVVLKKYPHKITWIFTRGQLYKELNLIDLSKSDFAIVKAIVLKNMNTFDTLQR